MKLCIGSTFSESFFHLVIIFFCMGEGALQQTKDKSTYSSILIVLEGLKMPFRSPGIGVHFKDLDSCSVRKSGTFYWLNLSI